MLVNRFTLSKDNKFYIQERAFMNSGYSGSYYCIVVVAIIISGSYYYSSAVVTLQRPSNPSRLKITDRSFYHQAPALWNSLPQHLRALSPTSPTQTNNSLLSHVFLSIPQTTENLPFPSILSSLDYPLSGLTLWNSTRPDLYVIHTPFHFSFISTSFIA